MLKNSVSILFFLILQRIINTVLVLNKTIQKLENCKSNILQPVSIPKTFSMLKNSVSIILSSLS